jgi:hypothetical protein
MNTKLTSAVLLAVSTILPAAAGNAPKRVKLEIRMEETLSSQTAMTGQKFTATLDKTVSFGDAVMFEKGAAVEGVVKLAEPAYSYDQPGELDLELLSIRSKGQLFLLESNVMVLEGTRPATDPRTGRPMGTSKGDVARATIGSITGLGRGGETASVPGTNGTVSASQAGTSVQVVVPERSKLTFIVSTAPADAPAK